MCLSLYSTLLVIQSCLWHEHFPVPCSIFCCVMRVFFATTMSVVLVKMTLMVVEKIYSDEGNGDKDSAEDSNDNVDSMIVAQTYPKPLFFSNKV